MTLTEPQLALVKLAMSARSKAQHHYASLELSDSYRGPCGMRRTKADDDFDDKMFKFYVVNMNIIVS